MKSERVVASGLGGADIDLVEGWMEEGLLPHLAGLRRDGTWARLRGVEDFVAGSVWPTFTAGAAVGRWAWSSQFADLNSDGWEDLIVANGFITTEDTGDL